jgi:hypothetical protein
MTLDFTEFCLDRIKTWLEILEEQAVHSSLTYYEPTDEGQQPFDRVLQVYLQASDKQRKLIRSAVGDKEGVLNQMLWYVYKSAEQMRVTKDVSWLRIGAAAAAIQSGRSVDYRDFLLALAELYVTAEEAGLDLDAEFRAVGGAIPSDFHTYAVVSSRLR